MKNKGLTFYLLFILIMSLTGCEIIADIFKAGMGVGIFLMLLVIALIIFIIVRIRRRG